ncbi:MAG: Lacal_2735 family protein [Phaeodactylibacter sp.]|nr:Lacal_2735 family protein [Phaeodactylibacter sp.]MCB9289835.1 Lacal_2735 family protein [Lewinellaceae bacterium]
MFGLFKKDPVKKLERQYLKLMEEAMRIQRSGDIKSYSAKVAEAEEIQKRIDELKGSS